MADRIRTNFTALDNNKLWNRGMAVAKAQTGNPKYSSSPVSMSALRSLLDAFKAATIDAMDGGTKARAERDSLRAQVISALNQIAASAQENADGDPGDSGFETYKPTRKTGQLVETPSFRKYGYGFNAGEILLFINAVLYAKLYHVRFAVLDDGVLGPWTIVDVPSVKSAVKISGLQFGKAYVFQVQAVGPANRSDWSSSKQIVCSRNSTTRKSPKFWT